MERHIEQIATACKEAGQHPEGIALYKVGKNPGLFTSKTGPAGEAATQALESGYLELLRTDSKAETVRLTPRGEAFLREHLDPKATLEELLLQLKNHQQTMPRWIAEIDAQFAAFRLRSLNFLEHQGQAITRLLDRAESALRRLEGGGLAALTEALEPWQVEVLVTLDQKQTSLPLADIFHALEKAGFTQLTIPDFQHGLLILRDRDAIKLIAENPNDGPMLEPEYALIDEGRIYVGIERG
jgi:hypothetical protein